MACVLWQICIYGGSLNLNCKCIRHCIMQCIAYALYINCKIATRFDRWKTKLKIVTTHFVDLTWIRVSRWILTTWTRLPPSHTLDYIFLSSPPPPPLPPPPPPPSSSSSGRTWSRREGRRRWREPIRWASHTRERCWRERPGRLLESTVAAKQAACIF